MLIILYLQELLSLLLKTIYMKAHLLSPNGALKTGWALTRKHFIVMLGLLLGIMVLSWIISMVGGTDIFSFRYWVISLVNIILPIWLGAGLNKIMLNAYAGEEPSFSVFGDMFRKLGGLIGVNLIVGIVSALPLIVGVIIWIAGLGASMAVSDLSDPYEMGYVLGSMFSGTTGIVSIILGLLSLYLTLRLMFAIYAYVDDFSVGVFGAIQRSWSMTHGNMGKIILCFLMMIVLNLIGLAVLIVGILVTLIISGFMMVVMYEQIKESEQSAVVDETAESAEEITEMPADEPEQPGEPGSAE